MCCIYLSPYDEMERKPCMLQCGHTFCENCLNQIHQSSENENNKLCPCCRQQYEDFYVNYALVQSQEDHK